MPLESPIVLSPFQRAPDSSEIFLACNLGVTKESPLGLTEHSLLVPPLVGLQPQPDFTGKGRGLFWGQTLRGAKLPFTRFDSLNDPLAGLVEKLSEVAKPLGRPTDTKLKFYAKNGDHDFEVMLVDADLIIISLDVTANGKWTGRADHVFVREGKGQPWHVKYYDTVDAVGPWDKPPQMKESTMPMARPDPNQPNFESMMLRRIEMCTQHLKVKVRWLNPDDR